MWHPFLIDEIFKVFYYSNLITFDLMCANTVVRHKLGMSLPVMKQCYWNLAGMLYPMKYIRWCTFWCWWQHAWFQSSASLKWNITFCDSTRQNAWSYLRRMAVPPSSGLLFNIFKCIFCPVQLQMIIFHFIEKGTGTERVAIATSKFVLSGIFHRVQHFCQVSITLLPYCWRYS